MHKNIRFRIKIDIRAFDIIPNMGEILGSVDLRLLKTITNPQLKKIRLFANQNRKKIVFTYGTFDLLHSGHASFLAQCKNYGDLLVVGVSSDKCKSELRGKGFPLIHQKNRAEVLNNFDFIDYTVIVDDRNLEKTLQTLKPDVFCTLSLDWKSHLRKPEEDRIVKSYKGKIVKISPDSAFISSSDIVERVADLKIKEIIEYFFGKVKIDLKSGDWTSKKYSGLKTEIREEAIYFGSHLGKLGLFGQKFANKIVSEKALLKISDELHRSGQKIVLSSGSCDLIHSGHIRFYNIAKNLGDVLVLAIPSDSIIRKQKGRGRPIVNEKSRAELMAFFNSIDYVYVFDTDSVEPLIDLIKPNIYFTVKEEWNDIAKSPIKSKMKKWEGEVVTVPPQSSGISSSKLIRKAAGLRVKKIFSEVLKEAEKLSSLKD